MPEYTCFLHPQEKGAALNDVCPCCGEPFGFPLTFPPEEINGKKVLEGHSRGFYGAILVTQHPRTSRKYAAKVIPKATYAAAEQGGYGKDFEVEARLHGELSGVSFVAALEDWGHAELTFHGHKIPCSFMEMEYVEGRTLTDLTSDPEPPTPRMVAQIALDLLDFVAEFEQRDIFHNDLHGYNVKVVHLAESEARRRAVHPNIIIKVLDLGSAADKTKSDPEKGRLGDIHWVAQHIIDLLDAYERSGSENPPEEIRLTSQLRRVAQLYSGRDTLRPPRVQDMREGIEATYRFGFDPWSEPIRLTSIDAHYNAQTLPPHYAPALLYDPGGTWAERLTRLGPQLLTGMRGCGKTMLLRSLEWSARGHPRDNETPEAVLERLYNDTFLGLFISSSSLLQGPRQQPVDLLIHRLFLAFAREAVRNLHLCELRSIGEVDFGALGAFSNLIQDTIPWYQPPRIRSDAVAVERAISGALQTPMQDPSLVPYLNPRNAFDVLTRGVRQLVDTWQNKKLLFLLDDVSTRYLRSENVSELLKELSIQSQDFGIVITTEKQTLEMSTPGGQIARQGRDYDQFDLGEEVLARLRGPQGAEFIENVLLRRATVTDAMPQMSPSRVLGRQPLNDIAVAIRESPARLPVYRGLEALVGMCVGDIGDVLQLYSRMLSRRSGDRVPLDAVVQDSTIRDFAENKLFALAGHDPWLYSHAVAFAQASHQQLIQSQPARLRQYGEIFVRIEPKQAKQVVPQIIRLVDEGVFVFSGGTSRTKTPRGKPSLLFKLAYRKVLGATNRIPLSARDRFELSGNRLVSWLKEPTADALQLGTITPPNDASEGPSDMNNGVNKVSRRTRKARAPHPQFVFSETGHMDGGKGRAAMELPRPRLLYEVRTLASGMLAGVDVDWAHAHVIAAIGFEDRTIGAWQNLLKIARPTGVTLLRYPDPGFAEQLVGLLSARNIDFSTRTISAHGTVEQAQTIISAAGDSPLVIDTTSLTKAQIFSLTQAALVTRRQVWVLHTCAAEYYPPEPDLSKVVDLFDAKDFARGFQCLDGIVAGEVGPFEIVTIGQQFLDPGQPSFMVAFVALKHNRVERLLETTPVERLAAIAPLHTAGAAAARSRVGKIIADYLAERHGGEVCEVGSLDHDQAYRLLIDLHRRFALEEGYNFEVALSGTKLQTVGVAMFASTTTPAAVYYSSPTRFDPAKFTRGTGETRVIHLERLEAGASA